MLFLSFPYATSCFLEELYPQIQIEFISFLWIYLEVSSCPYINLSLVINSLFRLPNICLSLLVNPSYIKNIYYTSILVVFNPFNCTLMKQGLNYFNTLSIKNNPIQVTCFIAISNPGPLLVILILIYIRNPLNLQTSPKKYLTNSI